MSKAQLILLALPLNVDAARFGTISNVRALEEKGSVDLIIKAGSN